ncbi:hypothetical protein RI367_006735 [Sorochytrium milnesiophthora]
MSPLSLVLLICLGVAVPHTVGAQLTSYQLAQIARATRAFPHCFTITSMVSDKGAADVFKLVGGVAQQPITRFFDFYTMLDDLDDAVKQEVDDICNDYYRKCANKDNPDVDCATTVFPDVDNP